VPGKQGWFALHQPREGKSVDETWLGDVADGEVPTCRLDERIADVADRVRDDGRETCIVVNDAGIVLGILRKNALAADPERRVAEVMSPGPKTFRPDVTLEELLKFMREHDIKTNSLVTTSEGRLLGIISRADAEATLAHDADSAP
jgi:CBS domain-containing protein